MPKFTESKTDRAYEGFDENDVHFVCRLNEIGSPASSGTHRRQKPSSGTWRKSSVRRGNPMTENQNNRIPGCRVMSKEGFWNLIAEVNAVCGQDQDKYMDMLTNMPRTSTTSSTLRGLGLQVRPLERGEAHGPRHG